MLFSRSLYTSDSSIPTSVTALNTDLIGIQANLPTVADAARARNPGIKCLMYISPIDCEPADTNGIISGIQYSVANANESWFLHKASDGTRLPHGSASYLLNLGLPAVQSAFLSHVQAVASTYQPSSGPWDGFFFDDFYANLSGFPTTVEYGTNGQSNNAFISNFQAAMAAFLDAVCPTLHTAGFHIIIPNIPFGSNYPVNSGDATQGSKIWNLYLGSTDGIAAPTKERADGGMEESFMNGGAPATTPAGEQQQASVFLNRIGEAKSALAQNKYFWGHTYSPVLGTNGNEQGHRYALGALLLIADPTSPTTSKLTLGVNAGTTDLNPPWFPSYVNALALGAPSGAYVNNGDGTYSRTFANGSIRVNPTNATVAGVPAFDAVFTLTSAPAAPVNTSAPSVSGGTVLGALLSTTNGVWTGVPVPTYTYQWKRAGVNIAGATGSSYQIQAADLGQAITCTVTATNSQGNASATSNTITPSTLSAGPSRRVLMNSVNKIHPAEYPYPSMLSPVTVLTASNPAWPIPAGAITLEVTLVGGGGQGGGGGTNASAAANEGGCGGGAGQVAQAIVPVGTNTTLNYTQGAGGTGAGAGGAAGGNPGTAGNNGSPTTLAGTGISLQADGGSGGNGGNANSTSAQTGGIMGLSNNGLRTQGSLSVGGGGQVGANGSGGADGTGWSGGGGGGGGTSNTTLGGGGGAAGKASGTSNNGGAAGGTGTQGTSAGGNGVSAAANSGAGGGGGGGAPSGGAGGSAGSGGSGFAIIRVIAWQTS